MSTPKHIMDMSDEEIANLTPEQLTEANKAAEPGLAPESGETGYQAPDPIPAGDGDTPPAGETPPASAETPAPAQEENNSVAKPEGEQNPQGSATPPPVSTENHSATGEVPAANNQTETPPAAEQPKVERTDADYATIGKALMQPIKANGKEIQLNNADEVIRMVQMGANYTKNMQELRPALRVVKMLQNNDLMAEDKVSFLIDLSKKNPQAIAKLLKDGDIEPLSLDSSSADSYTPGNHQVTDQQIEFDHALDDLVKQDGGTELLREIMGQWDDASKQAIYQEPVILQHLARQRSDGIYSTIMTEVDRLTTLGQIPQGTPFLQAYRAVGDMLQAQGKFGPPKTTAPPPMQTETPSETRVEAPAAPVVRGNGNAASTPRATATTAPVDKSKINFLEMPDDEFLKRFSGRL